jgi:hypothetical protein
VETVWLAAGSRWRLTGKQRLGVRLNLIYTLGAKAVNGSARWFKNE